MPNRLVFIIACLVALPSFAQEAAKTPSWIPKSYPADFDFKNLSIARISADKKTVQFARPKIASEIRTRTVTKTVPRVETKTRQVSEGGQTRTEDFTVVVYDTVAEEQTFTVMVPKGSERFDVAVDKISATDLSGNAIDGTALATKLQKPAYVMAMEGSFTGIDPFYLNLLRQDTIVIFVPQGSIPAPALAAPAAAAATVPAAPAPVRDPSA
jgi:hypothetical protein